MTITLTVPNKEIPLFKSAAKQMEIDLINEGYGETETEFHMIISDPYILVLMGRVIETDAYHNVIKNGLGDIIQVIGNKLNEFAKNNPPKDKTDK
jgi:hypothetical protein